MSSQSALVLARLRDIQSQLDSLVDSVAALTLEVEQQQQVAAEPSSPVAGPSSSQGVASERPWASNRVADRPTDQERERAAEDTGRFFLRCLNGQPRGDSGRHRFALTNRVYVVLREFGP